MSAADSRTTYPTFISIDYHSHPLHVNTTPNNSFQASRQLFVECLDILCGNATNVYWQVDVCRSGLFIKIDIRTVDGSKMIFLKMRCRWKYTKAVTLSRHILCSKGSLGRCEVQPEAFQCLPRKEVVRRWTKEADQDVPRAFQKLRNRLAKSCKTNHTFVLFGEFNNRLGCRRYWFSFRTCSFHERSFPPGWTRTLVLLVLDETRLNVFLNHTQ
jgi:hypothetical protein